MVIMKIKILLISIILLLPCISNIDIIGTYYYSPDTLSNWKKYCYAELKQQLKKSGFDEKIGEFENFSYSILPIKYCFPCLTSSSTYLLSCG